MVGVFRQAPGNQVGGLVRAPGRGAKLGRVVSYHRPARGMRNGLVLLIDKISKTLASGWAGMGGQRLYLRGNVRLVMMGGIRAVVS